VNKEYTMAKKKNINIQEVKMPFRLSNAKLAELAKKIKEDKKNS